MINYNDVSKHLTGKTGLIRKNHVPKKYSKAVHELEILIKFWQDQNPKQDQKI